MTRRPVSSLSAFDFKGDFSAQTPVNQADGTVAVSAAELAALLSDARAEGAASAKDEASDERTARLESISDQMRRALAELLKLAECLDQVKLPADAQTNARSLLSTACQMIIDGQGDLFVDQ